MDGSDDKTKSLFEPVPSFRSLDPGDLALDRVARAHDRDGVADPAVAPVGKAALGPGPRRPGRTAVLVLPLLAAVLISALVVGQLRHRARIGTAAAPSGGAPATGFTDRPVDPGPASEPPPPALEAPPETVTAKPRPRADPAGPKIVRPEPRSKAVPVPSSQPAPKPPPEPAASAYTTPTALPPLINDPDWSVLPNRAEVSRLYPPRAFDAGMNGAATIDCIVATGGDVMDCHVIEEAPRDLGFGAASLKLADRFRMRATTRSGAPAAGRHVHIAILWRLAEPPSDF